ncbi:MAG: hypothetical protein AAF567_13950 [Actinomycetota bacterium]
MTTNPVNAQLIHEDTYGSIIDYADDGFLETRWYDGSNALNGQSFNDRCMTFADLVESTGQTKVLIDAVQFGMSAEDLDVEFRDTRVTPRLNDAGLEKIALVVPADFPPVGAPPAPEGPADFPTAFFATRAEALAWLAA